MSHLHSIIQIILILTLYSCSSCVSSSLKPQVDIVDVSSNQNKTKILASGPDEEGSRRIIYLSAAAYCSNPELSTWSCPPCKKASPLGYQLYSIVTNSDAETVAILTVNENSEEIVIAFRGSYSVTNVLQDVTFTQIKIKGGSRNNSSVKIHLGLYLAAKSLYIPVVHKLNELLGRYKNYAVIMTGHSLGAAVAQIIMLMIQQKIDLPRHFHQPESYTWFGYGCPRVGDKAWADYWNGQSDIELSRVVNKADPIPHCPISSLGYVHHGTELWTEMNGNVKSCSKHFYEDPTCSNSMSPVYNPIDHNIYYGVRIGCVPRPFGNILESIF